MPIERHCYDEDEWEVVSEEVARKSLEKFYRDAIPLFEDLELGLEVYTDVAEYRLVKSRV